MAASLRQSGIPPEAIIEGVDIDYQQSLSGGSDATVYPGRWNAPVAVRVLNAALSEPENGAMDEFIARFGKECLRLRDLRHENIVQFMGVCTTREGAPGLVTEKMAETLEQRYMSRQLSIAEQMDIFCCITAALAYLNAQGLFHGGLTTRSILFTERSRGGKAKVADIGLARNLAGGVQGTSCLTSTQQLDSILYLPPETFQKPPRYNEKLDIFSLGVLMMSTILRREPSQILFFSARSEVQAGGGEREIPELQRRAADFYGIQDEHPAKRLIGLCLHNDPSARPSAREALQELKGLAAIHRQSREQLQRQISCPVPPVAAFNTIQRTRAAAGCLDCNRKDDAIAEKDHSLVKHQKTISKLERSVHRKDKIIDELRKKQDLIEEHFFLERVRAYNKDSSQQRGVLSHFTTSTKHTPVFPKWESFNSPLPRDLDQTCRAVIHCEELYICSHNKSEGCLMWRTDDAVHWYKIQTPPHTDQCDRLLSDEENLYFLSVDSKDRRHGVAIYQLTDIDDSMTVDHGYIQATWEMLPNGRCPVHQFNAACFIDKRQPSLIMVGGTADGAKVKDSQSIVSVYCLSTNKWRKPRGWPMIPTPIEGLRPVFLQNHVHLIGGRAVVEGHFSRTPALSLNLSEGDSNLWQSDIIPPVKYHMCDVCKVLGTIVVVGGSYIGTGTAQSSVYAFDMKNTKWLQLPSLTNGRQWPAVVFFRDQLLAFGGWDGEKHLHSAEKLSLSFFDLL